MSLNRIAARYAKSLIDIGHQDGKLDSLYKDMLYLEEALKHRELNLLVKSPIINTGIKLNIFKQIFEANVSQVSMAFINLVIKKSREAFLPNIVSEFIRQYKSYNKITEVSLITATELNSDNMELMKDKIRQSALGVEKMEISTNVDPAIIGGYILQIGDKRYDASVAYQLSKLKKDLAK
jgi:F-type H+-transporting ATPase subunit delta